MPGSVYVVQGNRSCFVNSQFEKDTGYSKAKLLGMDCLQLVLPDDQNIVRANARRLLQGERSSAYQYRIVTKNGKTRWVLEKVTSIQYEGRPALLGNFMDITECRQAQEQT